MNKYRMFQQIRLWAYLAMFVAAMLYSWYADRHNSLLFVSGIFALGLPFLEVCPECNKLCWQERGVPMWGLLWIGSECRNRHG